MLRIDLHVHTFFSGDASITPKMLVEQLHAHPSVKGVAITDHDTIKGYFEVKKLAEAYEELLIIPGIEVSVVEGHLNVLGVEEEPPYPITAEGLIDFAKERDGVIIVPHPYRVMGLGDSAKELSVDAVEVLNPRSTYKENKLAEKLARELKLPGVAGSDAHILGQALTVYTEMEVELKLESVLRAIKKGLVKISHQREYEFKRYRFKSVKSRFRW